MFKLNRQKSDRVGERFDFKFSNFQAIQVPKGWDKLCISIVSTETGKVLSKSGKASVWNGSCQWMETFSESIWISQFDSPEDIKACQIKLLVSVGSSRSGVLGEAIVNLQNCITSESSLPISLPLKKCSYGTILQVKIQYLNPRTKLRDQRWKDANGMLDEVSNDYDNFENGSDVSDDTFVKSTRSSSSNHENNLFHSGKSGAKDASLSMSDSRSSFDSVERSLGEKGSPQSNLSEVTNNSIGRQDSAGSQKSSSNGSYSFNDLQKPNNSFSSRISGSRSPSRNHKKEDLRRNSLPFATSPLRTSSSSKALIEAVGDTVEELRAEARMWEQNARKLKSELESMRKELSVRSEENETLKLELSVSQNECSNLRRENERLNTTLEELMMEQSDVDSLKFHDKDTDSIQKELEEELKFQKETNADLTLQLKKTQESNIEFMNLLQEMEETIENQRMEVNNLSVSSSRPEGTSGQDSRDMRWRQTSIEEMRTTEIDREGDTCEERETDLELQIKDLLESQMRSENTIKLQKEELERKKQEIEIEQGSRCQISKDFEIEWREKLAAKEKEIVNLKASLHELNAEGVRNIDFTQSSRVDNSDEIEFLKKKVQDLEKDCDELTEENMQLIFRLKKTNGLDEPSASTYVKVSESQEANLHKSEIDKLKSKIHKLQEELKKRENLYEDLHIQYGKCLSLQDSNTDLEFQLQSFKQKVSFLEAELYKHHANAEDQEIQIAEPQQQLEHYKEHGKIADTHASDIIGDNASQEPEIPQNTFMNCQKDEDEATVKESDTAANVPQDENSRITSETGNVVDHTSKESTMLLNNEFEMLKTELECKLSDLSKEIKKNISDIEQLKAVNFLKDEEIKALQSRQKELEAYIGSLEHEKSHLMDILKSMDVISSKHLDKLQNELTVLSINVDSQASANGVLQRKSSELESEKTELEIHLSELEEENITLCERVSGMEAQLRYLTDERESSRLALQNSEYRSLKLQDDITKFEMDMEEQKAQMAQTLRGMHEQLLEAQEECRYLKIANPKLQATAEVLIEECDFLQKSNSKLRKQKFELHEYCSLLEKEKKESRELFDHVSTEIEGSEDKFTSILEELTLKERALRSEIEALNLENRKHIERLIQEYSEFCQTSSEKLLEVESTKPEDAKKLERTSRAQDAMKRALVNASADSRVSLDEGTHEVTPQELYCKTETPEGKINKITLDFETRILNLESELTMSKQNQEVLMADREKLLSLLEDVKSNEGKLKKSARTLEIKLKASEFERTQLLDEISILKVQLQKTELLQKEVIALKTTVNEMKLENERLDASFQVLYGDYEDMKVERASHLEKISNMQNASSELEKCRNAKVLLEERVLRLGGDLTAREALSAQDAKLKNELAQIRRINSHLQRRIQCLEEEKQENQITSPPTPTPGEGLRDTGLELDHSETINKHLQNLPESFKNQSHSRINQYGVEGDDLTKEIDHSLNTQLENRLSDTSKAEITRRAQLNRKLSERFSEYLDTCKSSTVEEKEAKSLGSVQDIPTVLKELIQLRESYFDMSLKYAQVEAQRGELVMKLKTIDSEKSRSI